MRLSFPKEFSKNPDYKTPPVAHQVPLATVRNNVYVLTDGSLAAAFRIKGMEYDMASDEETVGFVQRIESALNSVPAGMQFKLLHRITHNFRELLEEHAEELDGEEAFARYLAWDQARRYYRAMEDGALLRSENLVVLTYDPQVRWWEADNKLEALYESLTSMSDGHAVVQRTTKRYRMVLKKFEAMIRPVVDQMGRANLKPERLENDELYNLAWETLNPRVSLRHPCPEIGKPDPRDPYTGIFSNGDMKKAAEKRPEITVVAPISEREQLCVSDWTVGDKWVRIDDRYYGAIAMKKLPTHVYPGMALSLANLGFEATIAIDAVMLEKQKELEKQWNQARSDASKAEASLWGEETDPKERQKAAEKKERYQQMLAANENPFSMRMSVVVSGSTKDELDERCDKVLTTMRNMENMQAMREHYAVDGLLRTTWPFSPVSDLNSRKALTSEVAKMMPVFSRWEGSTRPVSLVMDRAQRLVKHDPFPRDQLNRNKVITGKSGAGKSFAAQLADIQPHAARENTEILMVESGASFQLTASLFGGKFVKLGPSSEYQINPFDLPSNFDELSEEEQEAQLRYKYQFIKSLVMAMARIKDPQTQVIAENVIGTVAQRTYSVKRQPRMRDFYRLLSEYTNERDPEAEKVAGRLQTMLLNYVVTPDGEAGIYSKYFDCYTNFDVESKVIDFDLTDVKGDPSLLVPMTMVVILGLIYNRMMRPDGVERLIVVDEAWALIKEEAGKKNPAGDAMELFWREGRKHNASSAMISQNYSDLTGGEVGQAVVGNSPIQYFLVHEKMRQNDEAFRSAGFSQEKIEQVYNLETRYGEFSEILIKEGDDWGIVRLPSAGLKYWVATTDPQDLDVRRRYMQTYRDRYDLPEEAVVAILAKDYPMGTHRPVGEEMGEQDALLYAERWLDRFDRFSEAIQDGEPVPPDFS